MVKHLSLSIGRAEMQFVNGYGMPTALRAIASNCSMTNAVFVLRVNSWTEDDFRFCWIKLHATWRQQWNSTLYL